MLVYHLSVCLRSTFPIQKVLKILLSTLTVSNCSEDAGNELKFFVGSCIQEYHTIIHISYVVEQIKCWLHIFLQDHILTRSTINKINWKLISWYIHISNHVYVGFMPNIRSTWTRTGPCRAFLNYTFHITNAIYTLHTIKHFIWRSIIQFILFFVNQLDDLPELGVNNHKGQIILQGRHLRILDKIFSVRCQQDKK